MNETFIGKLTREYCYFDKEVKFIIDDTDLKTIFDIYTNKKIKLTIEVLPDEIKTENDSVKIQVKLNTIVNHSTALCNALRINPYCINEGVDGDEYISIPINIAKEYGLI